MFRITNRLQTTLLVALLSCGLGQSVAAQGMDQAQMQQMMENAQKMQACMSEVDQSAMEAMAREAQTFHAEIKALCAAGKRDQAMSDAMRFGKRVSASPEMLKMQVCQKHMQGMMPDMLRGLPDPKNPGTSHICDE